MITKYENNIVRLINNNNSTNYKFAFEQSTNYNYRESYYIKEEMLDTLPLSTLEQHKVNKLSDTDRVYFNKSSSIPRYKLKEYLDQAKLKINKTNRIAFADTFVASLNAYKTVIYSKDTGNKYYVIPVSDIEPHSDKGFKTTAREKNFSNVLVPHHYENQGHGFDLSKYPTVKILAIGKSWGDCKASEIIDSFVHLANKPTTPKIVFDETLIDDCNVGIVIDEEIYNNIRDMIGNKNKENMSLAMEIMSNSDYTQSKVNLLLLLNEFGYTLKQVPKTINYQSMLNYFVEYKDIIAISWERFSDIMLHKVCKTDQDKEIVRKYILNCFNRFLKNSKTKFTLDTITLN